MVNTTIIYFKHEYRRIFNKRHSSTKQHSSNMLEHIMFQHVRCIRRSDPLMRQMFVALDDVGMSYLCTNHAGGTNQYIVSITSLIIYLTILPKIYPFKLNVFNYAICSLDRSRIPYVTQ